jgi:lysozyme family protein
MSQDFASSLSFVLGAEGGFANELQDKGGPTNFGLTQVTYSAWLKNHNIADAPVASITRERVDAIYLEAFWTGLCDKLPSPLNLVAFDGAVQHGRAGARFLLASAMAFPGATVQEETFALLVLRDNLYRRIVARDPSQSKFLQGWLNRLGNLRRTVGL